MYYLKIIKLSALIAVFLFFISVVSAQDLKQYLDERQKLSDAENAIKDDNTGIHLSPSEQSANTIFKSILQYEELLLSNNDPPAINFFNAKEIIEKTQIYSILKKLPKGSILHIHQESSATYDYLIDVGTYLPNCYIYMGSDPVNGHAYGDYHFFASQPSDSNWVLLSHYRQSAVSNVTAFDDMLLTNLTLIGRDDGDYVNLWRKFDGIFGSVSGLITYVPITLGYMQHLINQSIEDNIQHIEIRKCFSDYYDLHGNTYNDTWFTQQMIQLVEKNRVAYNMPELSLKIIGCDSRHSNQSCLFSFVYSQMEYALELRNQYPEIFIGYDLVGPEDEGYPLIYFIDQFMDIIKKGADKQYPLDFYFHAGETLLYNNTNLYDAILLNSKRIGHGIQLSKHPLLMQKVKHNNIGIEVSPISNQILEFVNNFRAHPAFDLLNQGLPVTISPDDPAIYGYSGLTYDFYEVVTAWGLDLLRIKQLVLNSLKHSAYYNNTEKNLALTSWAKKWNTFIDYINTLTPPSN
ncbi:adenosine deaminase-related growth factor [Heterostelium album PN500]|uniref:adenosine deaminase n=1 Tax=Heterostelium pallidum (strain ATCC 26659 / Pp 5 / PN500) TaxID=670386 RepID=D3B0S8_HETP5|nr:adenosine deaminase-related growth factor [Heterostelium album PN500]EFA84902.1 adenosine deaminase-related growth factor [Heterostelium album PN500]|eukprot:XP_020437012.1 adenosine deaminase-related growth factor [Heterostelium album PN500]